LRRGFEQEVKTTGYYYLVINFEKEVLTVCVRVDDGLQKYLVEVIKGRRVVDFVFGLEEEAQSAVQI
jgi:hypothetical protein